MFEVGLRAFRIGVILENGKKRIKPNRRGNRRPDMNETEASSNTSKRGKVHSIISLPANSCSLPILSSRWKQRKVMQDKYKSFSDLEDDINKIDLLGTAKGL